MQKKTKFPPEPSKNKANTSWLRYAGLASEMMAMLGGAAFLGFKADQWSGWRYPICLIIFPIFALGVILWRLIKITEKRDG